MAEALAGIGLASSIVTFLGFAQNVVSRLNEFSGNLNDGTNSLVQIQTRLPLIINGLRSIMDRVDCGKFDNGAKAALQPIIQACHGQVKLLSDKLDNVLPASDASKWERKKKAIRSLAADSKVKKASEILGHHLQTLTFYHSIGGLVTESVVKKIFWLVPHDRNPNFVGRDYAFDQIDQAFKVSEGSQPKVALHGLGGIGKSQIALEYCFRKRHRHPDWSIFWVNAATVARFEESFQRMAKEFGLSNGEGGQNDSLMAVKSWLETKSVAPWVMIVDNVDDATAFFHDKCHNDRTPSQALPRCSHGHLLFTSRTRDVALDLASPETPISVDFLSTEEGLNLLRKRLGPDPTDSHLIELLTELGHIPLAITQAISFIMKRRNSVEQYLELYRMGEKSMTRLLSHEFLDHGRQEQTMESVSRTWQISFDWIQRNDPQAAEILCLMGFYQHHGVPERLLRSDDGDDFQFEDSIALLQAFSLLEVDKERNSYSTHRLIQVTTKLWLEQIGQAQLEEWALRALDQLARLFPYDVHNDDYLGSCQTLLPHADLILEQNFNIYEKDSDLKKAELLLRTGGYTSWGSSDVEDVCRRFKRALHLRQSHLGSDHSDTWFSMRAYFLALTKCDAVYPADMGTHRVADMGCALLSHHREVFGDCHPETIRSMSDLASFLDKEGEVEGAETIQRAALKLSEEVEGHKHFRTVNYMTTLAIILGHRKKFEEALNLWRESIKVRTELLGPVHMSVLTARSNLAVCLGNAGRVDEAISLEREVMALRERVLGPCHPKTLLSATNLADLCVAEGRHKEARDLLTYALKMVNSSQSMYTGSKTVREILKLGLRMRIKECLVAQLSTKPL